MTLGPHDMQHILPGPLSNARGKAASPGLFRSCASLGAPESGANPLSLPARSARCKHAPNVRSTACRCITPFAGMRDGIFDSRASGTIASLTPPRPRALRLSGPRGMKYRIFAIGIAVCVTLMMALQVVLHVSGEPGGTGGQTVETAIFFIGGLYVAYHSWCIGRDHELRLKQYAVMGARAASANADLTTPIPCSFDDLSAAVEQRLQRSGFTVTRDVALPNGDTVALAASRTEFSFPGVVSVPVVHHLFLWLPQIAAVADFDALFEGGFEYVRHTHRSSLLHRERVGHVILPCIVAHAASPELIAFASGRPPKRWMRFEFPVLYDLSTGRTFYYEKTPRLGAMLFPGARALANLAFGINHSATAPDA